MEGKGKLSYLYSKYQIYPSQPDFSVPRPVKGHSDQNDQAFGSFSRPTLSWGVIRRLRLVVRIFLRWIDR